MRKELSEKETERKNILESLALKVYGKYHQGECVGKELACECKKLDEINSDISALNASILQNRGKKIAQNVKAKYLWLISFVRVAGVSGKLKKNLQKKIFANVV